ncbi:MAG: ABC transporter permease [Clostridiales bacterium]|nr:ABC transporter permease [Clostridiales bacterium]
MERRSKIGELLYSLSPVLVFVLLFLGLEWAIAAFRIPSWLIATPSATLTTLVRNFHVIWPNLRTTLLEIGAGYLAGCSVGILLALIFTSNKYIDRAISPYVIFLIVTPQIIMVPLIMLWLGFGIQVKIVAVALSCFPINMMSTMTGVRSVSTERYELMKSLRATKLQTFFQVLIPSALPNVFTGLRLATIFATTSAVGAELISGSIGVGPQISYYTEFMQVDYAFAYVYLMAAVGVLFYSVINFLENMILKSRK